MAKAGPALSEGAGDGQGRETHGGVTQQAETPATASTPQATDQWPEREKFCEGNVITCYYAFPRHLLLVSVKDRTVGDWDVWVTQYGSPVLFL